MLSNSSKKLFQLTLQFLKMKKNVIIFFAVFFAILFVFAVNKKNMSGIRGNITPANGAAKIWAISGKDTFSVIPSTGSFSAELKPGIWKLYIVAAKGYKNTTVENIPVEDGRYTDAGEIKLVAE